MYCRTIGEKMSVLVIIRSNQNVVCKSTKKWSAVNMWLSLMIHLTSPPPSVLQPMIMFKRTYLTYLIKGAMLTITEWLINSWHNLRDSTSHDHRYSTVRGFKVWPKQLLKSQSACDNWSWFPSQVHLATLTVFQSRENFFQCQSETLCKEQDFINNPFKVKCLPLQF